MLTDHAALNFGNIWAAISHAPRTDAALLGLVLVCVATGACLAVYVGGGLAYQYWNEKIEKRLRRRMRMRRRRSAFQQHLTGAAAAPRDADLEPPRQSYKGLITAAWIVVLGCSVVAAASALTVEYFSGRGQPVAKRAMDRDFAQAPGRLRIDYELRQH